MLIETKATEESRPYLVYLPGIEGTGALASHFLAKAHELFAINQLHYPGHSMLTLEEMADGCVSALAEQGRRRAIWFGDSFGSAVALLIGLRHPQATEGLILAGGLSKAPKPSRLLLASRLWEGTPETWKKSLIKRRLYRLLRKGNGHLRRGDIQDFFSNGQLDFISWRLKLLAGFDVRSKLHRIKCPVFYLGGEEDGLVNTEEEAFIFRNQVEEVKTFLFPGCGHALLAERPNEVLELLNLFVPLSKRVAA